VIKRSKGGQKQSGWWPYEKRVEVISTYIALGNASLVEAATGVPSGTVRQWRCQDWWRELETQLRTEGNLELDSKLKKLVNRSLDAVMDRVENGEWMYNIKTGKIERIPAKLRDLAKVASEAIDKSVLLQKFTHAAEEMPKLDDHLKKLAQEFANIIQGNKDAVHDRRQERLQEGAELGTQGEAESGEGPGGEEQGPVDAGPEERGSSGCGAPPSPLEGREVDAGEPSGTDVRGQSLLLT
jgi:hypothetical protein